MSDKLQHFLRLDDFSSQSLLTLVTRAQELKSLSREKAQYQPLRGKTLATIFTKSSTRTRVSFDVGMRQLGGGILNLSPDDTQIGRGESIADTARVISSMVDGVMIRTDSHENVETFAQHSRVPVINGLTDLVHPCQLLADMLTIQECFGEIAGTKIAWIGDGNNVCHSFMNAARLFDLELRIATPKGYEPDSEISRLNSDYISCFESPEDAAQQAHVVVTDTWASMGQENEASSREEDFLGFQVTERIMSLANKDAIFLHCLPAYRGKEVSSQVIDGQQSRVFQEAENRLHAQKALLEYLLVD